MTSTAHRATSAVLPEFQNCPLTDFSVEANRRAQEAALQKVQAELGRTYPLIIGGEKITTSETFTSVNPAHPSQVIGVVAKATVELANKAVEVAARTFESWKRVPAAERAAYLFKAAEVMRQRRLELNAWMIYEASKSWVEADADTAEAIDFLEFYGREMLRLADKQPLTRVPGEDNDLRYIPLGVGVAIPPWNFPCAIMAGLTTSALVEHASVRFISFTGSRDVGLRINQLAAKHQPRQLWIKRTVLEMGGKDAVVVDETADLEAAATGIVASAFGFQGQKCSAGSRAIIVGQVYDQVVQKVVEKARALAVGDPTNPQNAQGAVIDENAFRKISEYIKIGEQEGKLLLGGTPHPSEGYFIPPTIFADVAPNARIAQEEIFGPVLAITKAENFDEALAIANGTEYGLTGALYSRNSERLERAKDDFHVGNLYLNRKCTGALVGVHPFGGFNMSGTDSKAGGRDYLLLFTQAKALSEKV